MKLQNVVYKMKLSLRLQSGQAEKQRQPRVRNTWIR